MEKNQFDLLKQKKFLPLFITQFLGAFNDNVFKNALVVMIIYIVGSKEGLATEVLVTLTGALLILPMFLFSATAGILADKYDKAQLIRIIKGAEVALMLMAGIGFILESVYFLMFVLFLMGTQSTFFGPIKYSILPQHLSDEELISGNALIEVGTFLAILLGNVIGVMLISLSSPYLITAVVLLLVAAGGVASAIYVPSAPPKAKNLEVSWNFVKDTIEIINFSKKNRNVFLSILAVSWFWLVGFTFLTQLPTLTKDLLNGTQGVYVLFLALFSVGIGVGSLLCNRLTHGRIEATFVPLAALGLSIFTFDLIYSVNAYGQAYVEGVPLLGPMAFLGYLAHWRMMIDLVLISVCAGIFVVPLYAIMQHEGESGHKARVIAANNVVNALFMAIAAILTALLYGVGVGLLGILFIMAVLNLVAMVIICEILPDRLLKSVLRVCLTFLYKVEVKGLDNLDKAGNRVIICPNHTSFIDGLLLAAFLPKSLTFAVNDTYAKKWWAKPIGWIVELYGLDPMSPMAVKSLVKVVKDDKICVIFPEGRITVTGALMKIYEGPGMIAYKAEAPIVPVRIEGAQYTLFSRLKGKIKLKWFPKITISVLPAAKFHVPSKASARQRRQIVATHLYQLMTQMMFESSDADVSLFEALKCAKRTFGGGSEIVEDIKRTPVSYKKLLVGSYVIGCKTMPLAPKGKPIGVMLPNSVGAVVTIFALQAINRPCAMINFTSGPANVISACRTTQVDTILTSKEFIETAKLGELVESLTAEKLNIVYMEDIKQSIRLWEKLYGMLCYYLPFCWRQAPAKPEDPAMILFTSGSEGTPKAVLLSSHNIKANINQLTSCVDFNTNDLALNVLPIFHSFGLTGGTLLPILSGLKVFLYPSPLHFRVIPELCYDLNATIFFGTNTFLANYAKYAHAYDFYSVRYVFSGAEKLSEDNRKLWSQKFGVRIFEGYGATETSPVISTNTPMHNKAGTVGRLLPGIQFKLESVDGIEAGGKLHVKGPNVMMGYMLSSHPGKLVPPKRGWYDTGDIVELDSEGYITIKGRAKRFAKIAGEMVSLTAVESMLEQLWPGYTHAVIAVPDPKKGEQLVLITDYQDADKAEIPAFVKKMKYPELMIPKSIKKLKNLPVLGTGKVDYPTLLSLFNDA